MTASPETANDMTWSEKLASIAATLPAAQAEKLGSLDMPAERPGRGGGWRSPIADHELAHLPADRTPPREDDPKAVRRVGVIGGGTAGYLTALALRAKMPWLEVTLVESSKIPVIGVGEATTPPLMAFLHHYIGIDPHDFLERVQPTWKLGILFDWGPFKDGIMGPFDWGSNSIGVLGSMATRNDPNAYTLQSLFMMANKVPVFQVDDKIVSMMSDIPFAYHLENMRLVNYLSQFVTERGIKHIDAEIEDVTLSGEDWVESLRLKGGGELNFDLYIDCTGFRSVLLGKALQTPYISFADSLYTDTAITAYVDQSEAIEPYTRATTMDAGWCWKIPVPDEDHIGYVHSAAHIDPDSAMDEIKRLYPSAREFKTVRFRTGRHEKIWRGNVIAMGNSYAFVEPLESSSLLMLAFSIMSLIPLLPNSWAEPTAREVFNKLTAERWDGMRWFLAIHYKYNQRRDTEFWRQVRDNADVSGIQPLLDVYAGGAPLHLRDPLTRRFVRATAPTFYELDGVDCMLLGQGYPAKLVTTNEPLEAWQRRKDAADALVARSMTQRQALEAFHKHPELTESLVYGRHSWVTGYGEQRWLQQSRA
ncbi:tryptophan 7-halogenase [Actinocrinis puniceicyclus]|uniref:Tryptophan 7-halogenase n=1 Tax=Actinocrinis puniceicyclus TaxID=977794 RepID=A0A8J8BAT3_9ACTN|nr:tryptophan halogenase family protein [Actinocrinis puniceicyclus]MBS2962378.1 tryptophan 7-halogenase [Actinocrinis puniceicyclus]